MSTSEPPLQELRDESLALATRGEFLDADERTVKRKDRSVIGRWVVAVFLAIVVVLILYALFGAIVVGWEAIKTPAEYASMTITTILVPVVTLLLGYYFGTSDRAP